MIPRETVSRSSHDSSDQTRNGEQKNDVEYSRS